MKLRRKFVTDATVSKRFQKCLALTIVLKDRLKTSRLTHYSLNKLCKISGVSHHTAKKYERWLIELGFIHFEGTQINKILVINRIASHTSNRNIDIGIMDFSSFFTTYRSLQSFIFMRIQHNKDYIRHLLQAKSNPKSPEECRRAKRKVKDLVKQGVLDSMYIKYKEYGLSYKRIAKEIGCCIRTAQRIVKFAVEKEWTRKIQRFKYVTAPYVNYKEIDGYTFSTKHRLCIVLPNIYPLSPKVSAAFDASWYGIKV